MPKKFYTSIPASYEVCLHQDCPMAATCLHQIAYLALLEKEENNLNLINPNHVTRNAACRYYRSNTPVIYARGFTRMQKCMFPDQYRLFKSLLVEKFGRNPYFERRNGQTALPPREQEIIRATLKEVGIAEHLDFDCYIENLNWVD